LPTRDGAGVSGLRSPRSLPGSGRPSMGRSGVGRSGESCGATKPPRTGRSMSGVSVCAWAKVPPRADNARHGKNARTVVARHIRPPAGPDPTMNILQQIHVLIRRVPTTRDNVVNGVKTIMVNDPLRARTRVA